MSEKFTDQQAEYHVTFRDRGTVITSRTAAIGHLREAYLTVEKALIDGGDAVDGEWRAYRFESLAEFAAKLQVIADDLFAPPPAEQHKNTGIATGRVDSKNGLCSWQCPNCNHESTHGHKRTYWRCACGCEFHIRWEV